jgi:hypothetical protein
LGGQRRTQGPRGRPRAFELALDEHALSPQRGEPAVVRLVEQLLDLLQREASWSQTTISCRRARSSYEYIR